MSERDVKLIIRAKNEASRTIDSVADSLKTLEKAQDTVGSSASKTDDLIGRLGQEFGKLNAQIAATSAMEKVSQHLNKAAAAVTNLQNEVGGTEKKLSELGVASKQAAEDTSKLEKELADLTARQKAEKAEAEAARQTTLKKSAAMKELASAQAAYNKAMKSSEGAPNRDDNIAASTARLNAAKAAVAENVETHKRLNGVYSETSAEIKRMEGALKTSRDTYKSVGNEISNTEARLKSNKEALSRGTAEYGKLKTTVDTATASMGKFAAEQSKVASTTDQVAPQMSRLSELMKALSHYSTGTGGFAMGAQAAEMRKAAQAADEARTRYDALRAEIARINGEVAKSGSATAAQSRDLRQLGAAANAAERELKGLSGALQKLQAGGGGSMFAGINRESRQAMSVMQRLRGEVLGLATAYVGLYGAISNTGSSIGAYQKMEAAQNRMGAVFKQNTELAQHELDWTGRQASRLGIEFGILADEYSKFAVAAQAANYATESTRTVFLRVAEAGRVNKLSMEQMKLIFLALQQMISKGSIQSEELKRQLGDQLPGAFNIMAEAMGLTTAELTKMMEKGELLATESNMLKFATELDKRFGPQLATSLRTTTTEIGRFQNNMFQAQLQFANGGFIDAFTNGLREMNKWLTSDAGADFFMSLGAAAGKAVDVIRLLAEHSDKLVFAIQTLIAVKAAAWFVGIAKEGVKAVAETRKLNLEMAGVEKSTVIASTGLTSVGRAAKAAGVGIGSFVGNIVTVAGRTRDAEGALSSFHAKTLAAQAGSTALAGGLGIVRGAAGAFVFAINGARTAVMALLGAMGGLPGIAVMIGSYFAINAVTSWITAVDDATSALEKHKNKMNEIVGKYEAMEPKARSWAKALEGTNLSDLENNVKSLKAEYDKLFVETAFGTANPFKAWFQGWDGVKATLDEARKKFREGKMTAEEYAKELNKIYASVDNEAAKAYIADLITQADKLADLSKSHAQAEDAAKKKREADKGASDSTKELTGELDKMVAATDASADALRTAATAADEYKKTLDGIKGLIPELAKEMKQLKEQAELDAYVDQLGIGPMTKDQSDYVNRAQKNIDLSLFSDALRDAVALVVAKEGFQPTGKWDKNAYRAGYGSDTVTLSDQSVVKITKGMEVSRSDAARDLERRIKIFQSGIKKSIGLDNWQELTKQQQAVLTSLAYNYGSLPERVAKVIRANGSTAEIAKAIDALKNDNPEDGKPNYKRRQDEARIFLNSEDTDKSIRAAEKRTEEEKKTNEAIKKRIDDQKFEITQQDLKNVGKEREAAIEAAARAAKQATPEIGEKELQTIRDQAAALWDKQQLAKAEKEEKKEIREALKEVNKLEEARNALIQRRKIYESQGETEKVAQTKLEIDQINEKLRAAVDNAIALNTALGGNLADAAIIKLENTKLAVDGLDMNLKNARFSFENLQQQFTGILESGVIGAFDALAQAIANGENAGKAFGQAMLQMLSQLLIELGKVIIQMTLLNALKSMGGSIASFAGMITGGVLHSGGKVGASIRSGKSGSAALWAGATRYHSGGKAGFKPNEMPAVLEIGEEVVTQDDPRHIDNLGKNGSGGKQQSNRTRILNFFDAPSFLSAALDSAKGEETILNFIRNNPAAFKQAMDG